MDWDLLWKATVIVIGGTLLLRIAGRKSIAQMTLAQVVIMIGIGSLLVQPIVGKNVWTTLLVGLALVVTLLVIEYAQVKSDKFEKFVTGQSKLVIENGEVNVQNLRKLRYTVDQLEMQLRQNSISNISDVQSATLEPNGTVGFMLKENKQPATKEDIQNILKEIQELRTIVPRKIVTSSQQSVESSNDSNSNNFNIFDEVGKKGHQNPPPKYLQ
ncbi:DUF421 domain-containing protein [Litchfieldia alkalitelluris]|uniref:DUF421 domain-containing protein n=1 Tax=Litchfieldia alkalitelluris TaxID=304268 RepID=UPI0009970E90|nr:DUF421 domain-containing protein [Litchfieldia alkalitelluris]